MKAKKLFAGLLASSLLLSGCGGSKKEAKSKDPVKLTWYTIGAEPKDLKMVQDKANEYLGKKIGVNIDMKFIDFGDYNDKMQVVINSGEDYDLAFTCSWAGDYLGNSRKGAFTDITEMLNSKDGKKLKDEIDPRFWQGASIDGKIYAVPNQKELGVAPSWVFTKEYVDKYNIPYKKIHTLKDLEPWLKLIKEKEPDVVPLYVTKGFSYNNFFDQLVDGVGVLNNDKSMKVQNMWQTKELKENLDILHKYYEAGYINKDAATAKDNKSVKRFVSKADGQPFADNIWSKDLGYKVVSSPICKPIITNGSTTGSMIAISNNSKHKKEAFEFLKLLNTDKYLRNLINFGVEGVHYKKVNDEQIKLLKRSKDYSVAYFSLGNLFITYVPENEPKNKWEVFKEFNKNSDVSNALGFKFDTSKVSNELAAIYNVYGEYIDSMYSGSVNVDEYLKKMNKKLDQQGMQKVVKEMQKQLDEWKKENKK